MKPLHVDRPQLSIVMPARNAAQTLAETLNSLKAQSYGAFELLLIDDHSTDGTAQLAREVWGGDERLRILQANERGLVAALQHGLAASQCELVARMDADDLAHPDRLRYQLEHLRQHADTSLVASQVEIFPALEGYRVYQDWQNALLCHDDIVREMFVESPLAHPSVMFRKHDVQALGGYRDCGWPEDYDLWLRMMHAGLRFAKLPIPLLRWRDYASRTSRIDARYDPDAFLRCKAHHLALWLKARHHTSIVIWGAGTVGKRLRRYLRDEGISVAAFVDVDERKIGNVLDKAPVLEQASLMLAEWRWYPVIASVGVRGARELIRQAMHTFGFTEGSDFLCAA